MDGKTPKVPLTFRIFRGDDLLRTETLTHADLVVQQPDAEQGGEQGRGEQVGRDLGDRMKLG